MQKIFSKQNLISLTLTLYVLSVFLDLHIFYNSFSTLIRVVCITLIFFIIFIKYGTIKERKLFLIYFIILGIYAVLHLVNANNFSINVPTTFNYFSELLYFYKMIMNILIIYIVYKLGIDLKLITKAIKISLWLICGSIVITNIFKLGYSTYSFEPIQSTIFSWFTSNNEFDEISGKGYFHLANQVIAIIILYYPILINEIKEKFNIADIILSFIVLLSMLILGNRLSTAGALIILLLSFFIYIFLVWIKKESFNLKFFLLLLGSIITYNCFLFYSPLVQRENYYNNMINKNNINLENHYINSDNSEITSTNYEDIKESELIDRFNEKLINLNFPLNYYKYENDPTFWEEMLTKSPIILRDSRYIETSIIERVKNLNNKNFDDWLGISYNRIINIVNIERDYIMQYYSLGIIGTILLLGVYFVIYIYSGFKVIFNLENKFNYKNIMLFMGAGFFLVAAYFSGNILNAVSTIIPLSFILGVLFNETNKKIKTNNKILGFKISSLTGEELIKKIKKDINDYKQVIIYNINPLIMMNFYKDRKIKMEFNKSDYNIPDGIGTIYASKMKNGDAKKRIAGIDFFEDLCLLSSKESLKIYLYGSKGNIAEQVKQNLENKYSNIKIVGALNGFVSEREAVEKIIDAKPDVLFIALGSPKQEKFIIKNKKEFSKIRIIMPVGGTFDVISGNIKRAPKIIIKLHLEWVYRMIKEPKRIIINLNIIKYLFLVIFKNNCYNEDKLKEK